MMKKFLLYYFIIVHFPLISMKCDEKYKEDEFKKLCTKFLIYNYDPKYIGYCGSTDIYSFQGDGEFMQAIQFCVSQQEQVDNEQEFNLTSPKIIMDNCINCIIDREGYCLICKDKRIKFSRNQSLTHARWHNINNQNRCDECQLAYDNSTSLRIHMLNAIMHRSDN